MLWNWEMISKGLLASFHVFGTVHGFSRSIDRAPVLIHDSVVCRPRDKYSNEMCKL